MRKHDKDSESKWTEVRAHVPDLVRAAEERDRLGLVRALRALVAAEALPWRSDAHPPLPSINDEKPKFIQTGLNKVDVALGGGIPRGALTVVVGHERDCEAFACNMAAFVGDAFRTGAAFITLRHDVAGHERRQQGAGPMLISRSPCGAQVRGRIRGHLLTRADPTLSPSELTAACAEAFEREDDLVVIDGIVEVDDRATLAAPLVELAKKNNAALLLTVPPTNTPWPDGSSLVLFIGPGATPRERSLVIKRRVAENTWQTIAPLPLVAVDRGTRLIAVDHGDVRELEEHRLRRTPRRPPQ